MKSQSRCFQGRKEDLRIYFQDPTCLTLTLTGTIRNLPWALQRNYSLNQYSDKSDTLFIFTDFQFICNKVQIFEWCGALTRVVQRGQMRGGLLLAPHLKSLATHLILRSPSLVKCRILGRFSSFLGLINKFLTL